MRTLKKITIAAMTLSALMLPAAVAAQRSIEVLDIAHGTSSANIKAKVDLPEGKSIRSVVGRTFYLPDGSSTTRDSYRIIDDRYVIADLDYHSGDDYFYRLEITLDDGTELKTDCYNAAYTEGAVWLSDLTVTWHTNPSPLVGLDECADGSPLKIHPDRVFTKGVSIISQAANGDITFNVQRRNEHNQPFRYAKFTLGLQAYKADGSNSTGYSRIIFKMNGEETGSRGNMYAYSNPSRGSSTYYFDRTEINNNGINTVGFQSNMAGGDNYANLGACRLYYNVPASTKQPQTVIFDNPGGTILKDSPEVTLSAYASGGTPVFYSIVDGQDLATLEGNVLRPIDGKNGEIVVEAVTLGDDTYAPASTTQTYNFKFGPVVEYLYTHKNTEDNTKQTMYLYVDRQNSQLEKLTVDIYDNVRSFTLIKTVDLIADGLESYKVSNLENVYAIPLTVPGGATIVQRLTYKFADEDEVTGHLCEGNEPFVYMTDLPRGNIQVGWHIPFYDKAYNGTEALRNSNYTYAKGYGVHAAGYVETPSSLDLSQFSRFCADVGGQIITNPSRGRLGFALYNGVSQPYLNTGNVDWRNVYEWDFPLQSTGAGKTLKITFTDGGDGNMNDIVCIGAPRFYYHFETRTPQTLDWIEEEILNDYRPFKKQLTATASSGLPVVYRLIKGSEYARIENGNILSFTSIPSEGEVVIEAYQPGSKDFEASETRTCSFKIRRSLIIRPEERIELEGGHDIDELIVFANANSAGQAVVNSGIVNVKKLVLKYTFVPGEWNFISFPSDFDLNVISNLGEKGFVPATAEGTEGTYLLREYDGQRRADSPAESAWTDVTTGKVRGMKGYIMKLERADATPVEITFNFDNVSLDFDNTIRAINLTVDLSKCEPETRHTVYVRPSNVKGNTLRVDLRYVPTNESDLPLNHARALENMRVMKTYDGQAIRLTLPEQTPARVAIYDLKGEQLHKAILYVAPMKIDISDLRSGSYRMVVIYGPASIERIIEL